MPYLLFIGVNQCGLESELPTLKVCAHEPISMCACNVLYIYVDMDPPPGQSTVSLSRTSPVVSAGRYNTSYMYVATCRFIGLCFLSARLQACVVCAHTRESCT